jgi:hypothetical protein
MLHLLSGSLGFACLIAACFVIAHGLSTRGSRRPALIARLVGGLFAFAFVGIASGDGAVAINLGFTAAVILAFGWLSYIGVTLYRGVPVERPVREGAPA